MLNIFLLRYFFTPIDCTQSITNQGPIQMNVLVYVDNLIVAGNDYTALPTFKYYMYDYFKMKNLVPLKYFLRIELAQDIISEDGFLGVKSVCFLNQQNQKLTITSGELLQDPDLYRYLVEHLIYLAITRPDLAYSINILSQFMHTPYIDHQESDLHVVCCMQVRCD